METRAKLRLSALRQNTIHSPNDFLPYELLACIFNFACPPIDFSKRSLRKSDDDEEIRSAPFGNSSGTYSKPKNKHDPWSHRFMPLILSAVCNYWRELAFSLPGLWSTFALEVTGWKLKSQVYLLRLYLKNTGSLPFSLGLNIRSQHCVYLNKRKKTASTIRWRGLEPLVNVIFREFPEKIRTLHVAGAPPTWMYSLSQQKFPNLKDLTFMWGKGLGYSATTILQQGAFTIQPSKSLRIRGARVQPQPVSSLPPLTILHLHNAPIDICTGVLLLCPYLVEYHSYSPGHSVNQLPLSAALQKPFTLPNLKRFGWVLPKYDIYNNWNIALLENIRLPNLEELQWHGSLWQIETPVFHFFSKLPETLHSFAYYGNDKPYLSESRNCRQFFSHFSSIQSLIFHKCSADFMRTFFRYISNHISNPRESVVLLPSMDTVTVRGYRGGPQEGMGRALITMVDNMRRSMGISHFTFKAEDCEVRWTQGEQIKCKRFAVRTEGKIHSYFTPQDVALF